MNLSSLPDVELWDVIAELVLLATSPSPPNPFAVDLDFFDSLPAGERLLASAAMLSLLLCILDSGPHSYNKRSKMCYNGVVCVRCHSFMQYNLMC